MEKVEKIEDFYSTKFGWLPDNIKKELGHFNVFSLTPFAGKNAKPVPYKQRDYFKITLLEGNAVVHYADKSVQVKDSLHAYQLSKRGNSLRVMAEAVRWGKRGARINTISPGIIITPLAKDELSGPRGDGYRRMIEVSAVGRPGTPDEVGAVGALLMGADGAFITGSDFLMDGGVTAAYWYGELAMI